MSIRDKLRIMAQTLTDAYDAACETYKILTGEQP